MRPPKPESAVDAEITEGRKRAATDESPAIEKRAEAN
jgi:hypothetical protein